MSWGDTLDFEMETSDSLFQQGKITGPGLILRNDVMKWKHLFRISGICEGILFP